MHAFDRHYLAPVSFAQALESLAEAFYTASDALFGSMGMLPYRTPADVTPEEFRNAAIEAALESNGDTMVSLSARAVVYYTTSGARLEIVTDNDAVFGDERALYWVAFTPGNVTHTIRPDSSALASAREHGWRVRLPVE